MQTSDMLTLAHGDLRLDIAPERGGGIARFAWGDVPLFMDARLGDDTPLGLSSFALVPFSNRIENGSFAVGDRTVVLSPNLPQASRAHVIHGLGWLERWDVVEDSGNAARLRYVHAADAWPWRFTSEQIFTLSGSGLRHTVALTNDSGDPMPAGLGLHPYFPRPDAHMAASFGGVWQTRADGIPTEWQKLGTTPDLLGGDWDTVFTGREGDIVLTWPTHRLRISPDADLPHTVVFTPPGADFFCVEPVSHATDAINRGGMRMLQPGETWQAGVDFGVMPLRPGS